MSTNSEVLRPRGYVWVMRGTALGFLAMWVGTAASGPGPDPGPVDVVGSLAFGALSLAAFWRASRMRVEASPERLSVFGYWGATHVSWPQVRRISVDYGGLHVVLADDTVVTSLVLGKANWRSWLHRRSRSEDIADRLIAMATTYGGGG